MVSNNHRARWAAIGAAVAISLGVGGGFGLARATVSSGDRTVFVPITPCRLFDTRAASAIGVKNTPLLGGDTYVVSARGVSGQCNLPAGAVGVVLNVTITNPTAVGFLTVFPSDVARPLASNLNFVGGQAAVPNAVTVGLSADGRLSVFSSIGSINVIADVVGYYEDHNHDDRYYTQPTADSRFFEGGTLRLVSADGTPTQNGAALELAVANITDASATKPYTVRLAPGTYDVGADGMDLKSFVDLEGAGEGRSIVTGAGINDTNPFDGGSFGTIRTADQTALRHITVRNTSGSGTTAVGVFAGVGSTAIEQTTIEVTNAASASRAAGLAPSGAGDVNVTLDGVRVAADAGSGIGTIGTAFGHMNVLDIRNSVISVTAGIGIGTQFTSGSSSRLDVQSSTIEITGGGVGVTDTSAFTQQFSNVTVRVSGGTVAIGFAGAGSGFHPIIDSSRIEVSGGTVSNAGFSMNNGTVSIRNSAIDVTGTGSVGLRHSEVSNTVSARYRVDSSQITATVAMSTSGGNGATTFSLGATRLSATTIISGTSASFKCVATYNGAYTLLSNTCT